MLGCDTSDFTSRFNSRLNVPGSQPNTAAVLINSSGNSSSVCSDTPTLVLGECDYSLATVMSTSSNTFDVSPSVVLTASSSPIPATTAFDNKNDVLRSHSRQPVPLPIVRVGPSSVIYCDSAKEMINSLFFRLEQQQLKAFMGHNCRVRSADRPRSPFG